MVFFLEIIYLNKGWLYTINLDEYFDIRTHWIGLYVLNNDVTYFDSLEWNIFQKKLKHLLAIKT